MLADEVLLKRRVAVAGGHEDDLPLVALYEVAVMPDDRRDRPGDLGASREPALHR